MERYITIFSVYRIFWSVCGIIFLINIVAYWGPIRQQQERIEELREQYSKLRGQQMHQGEKKESMEIYLKAEQSLQAFETALPTMDSVSEKARELSEIIAAKDSYPGVMLFKPKWIKELGLWQYSTLLTITNRYENIKQILAGIQNSPSLFCIEQLSIQKGTDEDQIELKFVAATYCR